MSHVANRNLSYRGSAPATPGFIAVAPECLPARAALKTALRIPASESTLGSHPCVALSSAQMLLEWLTVVLSSKCFTLDGCYPLNFVSRSMGAVQRVVAPACRRLKRMPRTPAACISCSWWSVTVVFTTATPRAFAKPN